MLLSNLRSNHNHKLTSQVFQDLQNSRYQSSRKQYLNKKNQKKKQVNQIWKLVKESEVVPDFFLI